MFTDEREDTLREVAACGNIKAVLHFAHAGVNLNSQNKMNGWTALHWAAHRGHEHVITALLKSGADPLLKTHKGQTALDLAVKHEACVALLKEAMGDQAQTNVGPEPELPIVPTYLKNPDLEKTWLLPDEFTENKVENIVRKQKAKDMLNTPTVIAEEKKEDKNEDEKEILVYLSARKDDSLLGSVYLKDQSIESALEIIKQV
ncbi:ankyrin [Rhizopus microsporus]|uniref:Ankyrin n=1 Tax=Rhizopus microsporus TaxID=58291 RepID=A0A1X0SEH9_RHIZD|nr:ankyrin [Rhizopus microsporus]